jgi:Raf kinase inhibitor-like YbhB/YbcL family protein
MEDPDAPAGTWVHWVLYDIPGTVRDLPAGVDRLEELPDGSRHGLCWGVDRFERVGYHGPLPPPGPAHRYVFHLYALDRPLRLPGGGTAGELRDAMASHVLAEATLTGLYARSRS